MKSRNVDEATILATVKNATIFLSALSTRGCADISSNSSEMLAQFNEAFKTWKLYRLANLFDRLRQQLVTVQENAKEESAFQIASIISDAVFTCKAIKTSLKGRLEDSRVAAALTGRIDPVTEKISDLTLVRIGSERRDKSTKRKYLDEYYLQSDGRGAVYKRETRIEPLEAPVKPILSDNITTATILYDGRLSEDFPPRKITFNKVSVIAATPEIMTSIVEQANSDYELVTTMYKAYRSNLFAPESFYTLVKFHKLYSSVDLLYLVDEKNKMLKIADPFVCPSRLQFLTFILENHPEAIFGKIIAHGQDLLFYPLSVIDRNRERQITELSKELLSI